MRPEVGGQQRAVSCSHAVATPPHSVGAPLFVAGTPTPIVGLHGRHADICRSEAGIETLGPVEVVLRLVDATATIGLQAGEVGTQRGEGGGRVCGALLRPLGVASREQAYGELVRKVRQAVGAARDRRDLRPECRGDPEAIRRARHASSQQQSHTKGSPESPLRVG